MKMFFSDLFDYIKPILIPIVILSIVFSLDAYLLEPYVEEKYLLKDRLNYENKIWTYVAYVLAAFCLISIIYISIIERSLKYFFGCIGAFVMSFMMLFLILKRPAKKMNLIVNTWFTSETFQKEYKISRNKTNDVRLYSEDILDQIFIESELNTIEKIRKEKHLPSIYDLKDGDTVNVSFAKNYLDIKYLK
jgi:hypothetical protein